jgi:hypothetical protein
MKYFRMIKQKQIRWPRGVEQTREYRNAYNHCVLKPEGNGALGRTRLRRNEKLKSILKKQNDSFRTGFMWLSGGILWTAMNLRVPQDKFRLLYQPECVLTRVGTHQEEKSCMYEFPTDVWITEVCWKLDTSSYTRFQTEIYYLNYWKHLITVRCHLCETLAMQWRRYTAVRLNLNTGASGRSSKPTELFHVDIKLFITKRKYRAG